MNYETISDVTVVLGMRQSIDGERDGLSLLLIHLVLFSLVLQESKYNFCCDNLHTGHCFRKSILLIDEDW